MASDRHELLLSLALSYLSLRLNIPAESSAERRRSHAKHPPFPFSLPSAFYALLSSSLVSPSASVSPGRQGHLPPTPSSSALISPPVLSPCSHQLSPAGFREAARRGRPLRFKSTFRPPPPFSFHLFPSEGGWRTKRKVTARQKMYTVWFLSVKTVFGAKWLSWSFSIFLIIKWRHNRKLIVGLSFAI